MSRDVEGHHRLIEKNRDAGEPVRYGGAAVYGLVERFDRRGTEPFELFRSKFGRTFWSEFCQN